MASAAGAPPKHVVSRILNYSDKEILLRVTRIASPLHHDNNRVYLFPDYTLSVQATASRPPLFTSLLSKVEGNDWHQNLLLHRANRCLGLGGIALLRGLFTSLTCGPTSQYQRLEQGKADVALASGGPNPGYPHTRASQDRTIPGIECCWRSVDGWALTPETSPDNEDTESAFIHSEESIASQFLPDVTPQMADEIL
ncbi:hypothetical protein NDU88_004760 [Pleurodeles waltl]|uniref:Uncharacterized protein n=1 Tax=Pleurodeles waltl TaxID=8319 RepID=A0AAV7PFX2_PLEWA|nr:hypothetical protein NDU88_004760 [Pleurodeles waltl]